MQRKIKNKRVLKNGAIAGYVLQKDGSWKWRIVGSNKKTYKGGNKNIKVTIGRNGKKYYFKNGKRIKDPMNMTGGSPTASASVPPPLPPVTVQMAGAIFFDDSEYNFDNCHAYQDIECVRVSKGIERLGVDHSTHLNLNNQNSNMDSNLAHQLKNWTSLNRRFRRNSGISAVQMQQYSPTYFDTHNAGLAVFDWDHTLTTFGGLDRVIGQIFRRFQLQNVPQREKEKERVRKLLMAIQRNHNSRNVPNENRKRNKAAIKVMALRYLGNSGSEKLVSMVFGGRRRAIRLISWLQSLQDSGITLVIITAQPTSSLIKEFLNLTGLRRLFSSVLALGEICGIDPHTRQYFTRVPEQRGINSSGNSFTIPAKIIFKHPKLKIIQNLIDNERVGQGYTCTLGPHTQ